MSRPSPKRSRLFEELVTKSWWLILFFFLCYFAYDQAAAERDREALSLKKKLKQLHSHQEMAKKHQDELKLQLISQSDPAWIEMVLMKELGLVPEGQTKVHFVPK